MSGVLGFPPLKNTNITATTQIWSYTTEYWSIVIDNTHADTATLVTLVDGSTDGGTKIAQFTVKAGENKTHSLASPFAATSGLRVVIAGGTVNVGVFWRYF